MLEITGATLLSVEEAKQLDEKILKVGDCWWLRSPGLYDVDAACVYGDIGSVYDDGRDVRHSFGVRPALQLSNLEGSGLQIGDKFTFGDRSFTVISEKYALCDENVWRSIFREDWEAWEAKDANVYEKSDIKKFVDDWFEKALEKENDNRFVVADKMNTDKKESICFDCSIYTNPIGMFEYATGNNAGHYDVVDAVVSQIGQGDPVIEDVEEELNERFGDGAADHLDDIDLKDYITYTGACEIDYEEMAAGDSDLLVYRVSCEFDVDKFAREYDLKEIDEHEEDKEL